MSLLPPTDAAVVRAVCRAMGIELSHVPEVDSVPFLLRACRDRAILGAARATSEAERRAWQVAAVRATKALQIGGSN